jgi:hypothetical protein
MRWRGGKNCKAFRAAASFCGCLLGFGYWSLCIHRGAQEQELADGSIFFPVDNAIILAPQQLAQNLFHGGFLDREREIPVGYSVIR